MLGPSAIGPVLPTMLRLYSDTRAVCNHMTAEQGIRDCSQVIWGRTWNLPSTFLSKGYREIHRVTAPD